MTFVESVITSCNYLSPSYVVLDCCLVPLFGRVSDPTTPRHIYVLTEEATNYYYQERK